MFYSRSAGGFFDPAIHTPAQIPGDAIEITREEHAALLHGQGIGLRIGADAEGRPLNIIPPAPTVSELITAKKAALASIRYGKEVGGLTLANGMRVATDDRSKALIAGARVDTMANPTVLTDWKTDLGWCQIDATAVTAIATAVAGHVRACFGAERSHAEAIDALAADPACTSAEIDAYDITSGWPL